MSAAAPIRVLVVDDPVFAQALTALLDAEGFAVVGLLLRAVVHA